MRACLRAVYRSLVVLLVASFVVACGARTLQSMKESHREGALENVVAVDVACTPNEDGCAQMHLLKGDACYRLGRQAERADQDSTAAAHLECADTHLSAGIEQAAAQPPDDPTWQVAGGDRTQWYANWAETLRQLQDLRSGEDARRTSRRLLDVAEQFQSVAPEAAAPSFYAATARFALLQPDLIDAPAGDADACGTLTAIHDSLADAPAGSDPVADRIETLQRLVDREQDRLACP